MGWSLLLGAALEAGLGLIATVGFEDEARALKERLLGTSAKQREQALQTALDRAAQAVVDTPISPLIHERGFQEEVIAALLDPTAGFDFAAVAARWEVHLPAHKLALSRFFSALNFALTGDELWGPMLDRYQNLRFNEQVTAALQARQLDLPAQQMVHQLNMNLTGQGALAIGGDVERVVQVFIDTLVIERREPGPAESQRVAYLQEVARDANLLPWSIINVEHADPGQGADLRLADVYTTLDTTTLNTTTLNTNAQRRIEREEELRAFMDHIHEAKRIPAQEMANEHPYLLIMGDPGSGKSTFVKHLTYIHAQANLADDPTPWMEQLEGWTCGPFLPLRIELRHLAAFAAIKKITTGDGRLFTRYLRTLLADWGLEAFAAELLAAPRNREAGLLLLLDGLDEVPTEQRQLVVDMVNALRNHYGWHRYIVTCRPYAYVGQKWKLHGFHQVTLAPFTPEQSDLFVENWYQQLAKRDRFSAGEAGQRIANLQREIKRADLREMAERPLLLTVMTQLHAFRRELPDDRTELYADAVDLLLRRWEGRTDQPGLLEQLDMPHLKMSDLQAGLYRVAYEAHAAQQEGETADIGEGELREWLQGYLDGDWNKAGLFIEYIRERAGLLIRHKTAAYTFPHRSFQEFLAACHLVYGDDVTSQKSGYTEDHRGGAEGHRELHKELYRGISPRYIEKMRNDYPATAARLVREDHSRWREVFLLAAGHAARVNLLGQAIASVNELCPLAQRDSGRRSLAGDRAGGRAPGGDGPGRAAPGAGLAGGGAAPGSGVDANGAGRGRSGAGQAGRPARGGDGPAVHQMDRHPRGAVCHGQR